ncbi:MAG: hypothetical protein WA823_04005 [Candidatus Acidiferrales bacterium]
MNMAPPRRDNNAVWWILGIVAGGIMLMIVFGLALAGMFLHRVHLHSSEKNVDVQTPVGEFKVNTDGSHHTGLPLYPGATVSDPNDGNAHVELSFDDNGVGLAVETYKTGDSLDDVSAWYQKQLGPSFRRETPKANGMPHHANVDSNADVAFVDDKGGGARVVALTNEDDGVKINLVRVGKRETQ